jgi:predicted transcriptional regulator
MGGSGKSVTVYLQEDLIDRVQAQADRERRSFSQMLGMLAEQSLRQPEREPRPVVCESQS